MSDPTMSDALRSLARSGTAGGPAVDNLRRRWKNGAGSLSAEQLAEDPALQAIDPAASLTESGGTIAEALSNLYEAQRRMTARPTRKDRP